MSFARALKAVLASLYLLVGIGFGVPSARPATQVASTEAASTVSVVAIDCADHAVGAPASHLSAKSPCAPTGKLADHHRCPDCPIGGSCCGVPTGTTGAASVLVRARSANEPTQRATTDPTGLNPHPDPRPPRALA